MFLPMTKIPPWLKCLIDHTRVVERAVAVHTLMEQHLEQIEVQDIQHVDQSESNNQTFDFCPKAKAAHQL